MQPGDSFFALKNYAKGKINRWELVDSDPIIYEVRHNENPAQSVVYLRFKNDEDFLKILGVSDDDIWLASRLNSYYVDYSYMDEYSTKEDFNDGYGLWHELNEDNWQKMIKISEYLGVPSDLVENEDRQILADKLYPLYKREIDDIISDYTYEVNQEINQSASEYVKGEITDFVEKFGFELLPYDGVKTTVADLISLYIQYNVPHVSLKKLLKEVFKNGENELSSGWTDNMYEYRNDKYFDKDSFNRNVERNLDKIIEDLEEKYRPEILQMIDRVLSKVKRLNNWVKLPKDPRYRIQVNGFDKDNEKIQVRMEGPGYQKQFSISEDGFNKLLYNLELFDLADKE